MLPGVLRGWKIAGISQTHDHARRPILLCSQTYKLVTSIIEPYRVRYIFVVGKPDFATGSDILDPQLSVLVVILETVLATGVDETIAYGIRDSR